MKSNKIISWFLLALFIILMLVIYVDKKITERHIKKNLKIGVAHIYKAYLEGRYSHRRVSYTILNLNNGQSDSFDAPCDGLSRKVFRNIENHYFPVVYDSTNTKYNDLILEKSDFLNYDIFLP